LGIRIRGGIIRMGRGRLGEDGEWWEASGEARKGATGMMRRESARADWRNGDRNSHRGWPFRDRVWRRPAVRHRTGVLAPELYWFIKVTQVQTVGGSASGFVCFVTNHNDRYLAMKSVKTNAVKQEP
jgi:hypothetical protein